MAELAENPRHTADRIVDPEYVVKDKRFAEHIDARFDVVIANHVIEHVADPITWLQQIRVVAPHGDLFLAVPDRRHTFDYLRPDSTIAPMLRAHSEDLQQPSRWQLLDTLFYYRPFRAENAWAGDFAPLEKPRFTVTEALKRSLQADDEYVDTHCHMFSAPSFAGLIADLSRLSHAPGMDEPSAVTSPSSAPSRRTSPGEACPRRGSSARSPS